MWLASVIAIRKARSDDAASKEGAPPAMPCSSASASRTGPISASARGVGRTPAVVRTNSGSASCRRSLPSQMLTVGWERPSFSAARVMLWLR